MGNQVESSSGVNYRLNPRLSLQLPPPTFAIAFLLGVTFSHLIISYIFFLACEPLLMHNSTKK